MSRTPEEREHDRAELLEVLAVADAPVTTENICRRVAPDLRWDLIVTRVRSDLNALERQQRVACHGARFGGVLAARWSLVDARAREADEDLADLERMLAGCETDDERGTTR